MSEPDAHCLHLIEELLLEAGRLMENSSVDFTLSLPDIAAVAARIDGLDLIAGDLQALSAPPVRYFDARHPIKPHFLLPLAHSIRLRLQSKHWCRH